MNKNTNKIKLLISINDFLVGGAQKLIIDQLGVFDLEKFDITLLTLFQFSGKKNFYHKIPEDIRVVKFSFKGFVDPASWLDLYKFLKKERFDVITSHLFFSNTVIRILKIFLRFKVITVEHNTYINKRWWEVYIDKILARFSYRIIAVSESVRVFAIKQADLDEKKVLTIHNGIDKTKINDYLTDHSKTEVREELGFEDGQLIFLNVGRLTSQKNHKLLISSFVDFHKKNKQAKLIILGEGGLVEDLKKQISQADAESFIFLMGSVDNVSDYYFVSDFLVSTSFIEGLSIAYLEAFSFGLPIIATKTAGTDEIIQSNVNGEFIKSFEPNTVVASMESILQKPYNELSENAKTTSNKFSIEKNVEQYKELILKALSDK